VAYTAVCATDLEIYRGTLGYYANGLAQFPITPGHEFSGTVAAVGQNVRGLSEGDPVVAECIQSCGACSECASGNFIGCPDRTELGVMGRDGAYARYTVVPAQFVHKLPDTMDLRRAALVEPAAVCLKAIRRIEPMVKRLAENGRPRCAVVGSGPLGHLCSKILTHKGMEVTAFDRNPKRRALFEGTAITPGGSLDDLSGFQIIVEITGDPGVLDRALHTSPPNATLVLLGLPYGEKPFSFEAIAAFDKTVTGSVGSTKEDFEEAIELLPQLDLEPYFEALYPMDQFEAAWAMSETGDVLKVMLDCRA
jgi:threonine dehydrogenase-like Zn-dependent dehydrogenase